MDLLIYVAWLLAILSALLGASAICAAVLNARINANDETTQNDDYRKS